MITNPTILAIGTSAGSLLVTVVVGAATGILTYLALRHHQQVFALMKRINKNQEDSKDFENATTYLKELLEKLCEYAQKPCQAADFTPLTRLHNLVKDIADEDQMKPIRTELVAVATSFDHYLTKVLPPIGAQRLTVEKYIERLELAMKQERARIDLVQAIKGAQQKIRTLCKGN
ncbi:hypothetical protein [Streptomyces sp. NBC_00459]|uniref:hypothetical protein n=1 Tax=Streptomyces sp. NBC_00459 TaxID=2975749 RepID=UPI002E18D281